MDFKLIILGFVYVVASAREISFEDIKPTPVTNLVDYGTLRIKRIKRNQFTISGSFNLTRNAGNEKLV